MPHVSRSLAQLIVDTVKDVCGYDINFINASGIIYASTDSSRIGTYHEIGNRAAQTQKTIEVTKDQKFEGTNEGVNLPVFHRGELIAVIGISGNPDETRKYAALAEKITRLLIREQDINALNRTREELRSFVVQSLTEDRFTNIDYLRECMDKLRVSEKPKRVVCFEINSKYHIANLSMFEAEIYKLFASLRLTLYAYRYPRLYIAVIDEDVYQSSHFRLAAFAARSEPLVRIGVGTVRPLFNLSESYRAARSAVCAENPRQADADTPPNLVCFDNLTIELVLSEMSEDAAKRYREKILKNLTAEDIRLLNTYFKAEKSLAKTSQALYVHKNTVQNHLTKIAEKTGLDPRVFTDSAALYLACRLK